MCATPDPPAMGPPAQRDCTFVRGLIGAGDGEAGAEPWSASVGSASSLAGSDATLCALEAPQWGAWAALPTRGCGDCAKVAQDGQGLCWSCLVAADSDASDTEHNPDSADDAGDEHIHDPGGHARPHWTGLPTALPASSPTRESLPRSPLGTPSLPPASRLGLLPPVAPKDSFSFPRPSPARTDLPRRPSDPGRPRTVSFAEAVSCFETWGKDEYLRAKTPEQPDYGGGEEAEWEAAPLVPVLPTVHLPARAAPPPVQSPPNPKPRGLMPSLRNMLRV